MNRYKSESAVDRLIALASDDEPARENHFQDQPETVEETVPGPAESAREGGEMRAIPGYSETSREMEHNPMAQALMPFRGLVPYIARILEMAQAEAGPGISAELKQTVNEMQGSQHDLRMAVQDQVLQMKRLEEEVAHTREASERNAFESSEMVEDLRTMHSLVKKTAGVLGTLLVALIALVVYMLLKQQHLIP
jgi:hypothetical protein